MNLKHSDNKLNWSVFSQYRNQLFGISILSVILFHYLEDYLGGGQATMVIMLAKVYHVFVGSIGVEIFLFLSGLGMYFSLSKNFQIDQFYKKRLSRVVLPYLIYGLIFWIIKDIVLTGAGISGLLMDYTLLSFWIAGNKDLWYVAFICVMYVLSPLIFLYFQKAADANKTVRLCILVLLIILGCTLFGVLAPDVYQNTEIALTRIPIFLCGMYLGKTIMEKKAFTKWELLIILSGLVVKAAAVLLDHYDLLGQTIQGELNRFSNGAYTLPLSLVLILLLKAVHAEKLDAFLCAAGKYSFELYITHVTIRNIFNLIDLPTYKIQNYLLCVVLSVIISVALSKAVNRLLSGKQGKKEMKSE